MGNIGTVGLIIIIINVIVTYFGLRNETFSNKYSFRIDDIIRNKEYQRLLTSGFLHVSWTHLIFNMFTLYFFSYSLESTFGPVKFITIYLSSLVGGNLLTLFIHRNHPDYAAVGASGAISGIVFASIALFPGMQIGLLGLPFYLPGWVYGLFFVLYSIYGIQSQKDNIGHEAHLGGGLFGLIVTIAFYPKILIYNHWTILLMFIPSIIFIYIIATKPQILLKANFLRKQRKWLNLDDKYNEEKKNKQIELDRLLDKINKNGVDSLTIEEKERLKELSGK
jgi:membrane associated rhomboid family serine protease